jgi:hypothetical protein
MRHGKPFVKEILEQKIARAYLPTLRVPRDLLFEMKNSKSISPGYQARSNNDPRPYSPELYGRYFGTGV